MYIWIVNIYHDSGYREKELMHLLQNLVTMFLTFHSPRWLFDLIITNSRHFCQALQSPINSLTELSSTSAHKHTPHILSYFQQYSPNNTNWLLYFMNCPHILVIVHIRNALCFLYQKLPRPIISQIVDNNLFQVWCSLKCDMLDILSRIFIAGT